MSAAPVTDSDAPPAPAVAGTASGWPRIDRIAGPRPPSTPSEHRHD